MENQLLLLLGAGGCGGQVESWGGGQPESWKGQLTPPAPCLKFGHTPKVINIGTTGTDRKEPH